MEAKTVWVGGIAAIVLAGLWLPTNYVHRSILPTEDPKFIRRVYADHTVGQTFHTKFNTDVIRVLLRSNHPAKQTLHAAVAGQNIPIEVELTEQAQWVSILLADSLPRGEYHLTLAAPEIKTQTDAILVRFQIASTDFEPGSMIVDGKASYGDIAFQFVDRIPAWKQAVRYFITHPAHTLHVFRTLVVALTAAVVVWVIPPVKAYWRYSVFALVILAVGIRIPTLASIDGVFGGDAFNYVSKAKAWVSGQDPFNAEPRKGPFLPFLLIPTLLTNDPIVWSRFTGAISAGVAAAAVALTLRQLHATTGLALLGGLLVAINREMWWESLNGLANVPYAALIALTTLSYTANTPFATSLSAALTALTRYEGILVGLIYMPALWIRNRFRLSTLRRSVVPLLLLAIPFVFWPISGALGVRTVSDVTSDTGLYIAWDWGDYKMNLQRFQAYLQELWFFRYERPLNYFTWAIYAATAVGALALLRRRPAIGIPLFLVAALQIAAVTAILPKTRYYVQIVPLLAMTCMYGLSLLPRRVSIIVASVVVASVAVNSHAHLPELIEDYTSRSHSDSVLLQTSVYFKKIGGQPAFATNFFAVETYLPLGAAIFGAPAQSNDQLAWLKATGATHLVETTEYPWFEDLLTTYPQHFKRVTSFKASYDPAQATIYEVTGL